MHIKNLAPPDCQELRQTCVVDAHKEPSSPGCQESRQTCVGDVHEEPRRVQSPQLLS